jgi:uncharacterized membrane protein
MRDWISTIVGILVLVLGIIVYLSPDSFKVNIEFFPFSVAGIIVLGLGVFLIVIGLVSIIAERLSC